MPRGCEKQSVTTVAQKRLVELLERHRTYEGTIKALAGRDVVRDLLEELVSAMRYAVQVEMELDSRDAEIAYRDARIAELETELDCLRLESGRA